MLPPTPAPLFTLPLEINGEHVGSAILDTGGGYELLLRQSYGLTIEGQVEVLAFGGVESVSVVSGFEYSIGGITRTANAALVGISTCDCNGIGYRFLRNADVVLAIDFRSLTADLLAQAPSGPVELTFEAPPPQLPNFDSSFITVEVRSGGQLRILTGLLDTGTNSTVMRRGLFPDANGTVLRDRLDVLIDRRELGTVAANVGTYTTEGLPDIILGTDVMRAWADRWYFTFEEQGGWITAIPRSADPELPAG